ERRRRSRPESVVAWIVASSPDSGSLAMSVSPYLVPAQEPERHGPRLEEVLGASRMLARQAPGSLAMSCQVSTWQRLAHDAILLATISYGPTIPPCAGAMLPLSCFASGGGQMMDMSQEITNPTTQPRSTSPTLRRPTSTAVKSE